ncbi:MAG: hypothetical protein BAJALOKI3v1_190038 [Promethearchaeota archaeon]|nr:MAG: hypothetical protein BAJALOKI3v1_190038 [Candidatus Lokiarchaeota archaeon]
MKEFLKKLGLSENAINIYLKVLGDIPHTYYELKAILPEIENNTFNDTLEELNEHKLIITLETENKKKLKSYYAVPPITPILNYYSNIESSFSDIKNAIQNLIVKSVGEIFQNENKLELDSIYNDFKDIKKDFDEDSLLQKKDAEDIAKEMDNIKDIETEVSELQKRIMGITQTEFGNLVKIIGQLRKDIISKIQDLNLKKREEVVIEAVEEVFDAKVDKTVGDFTNRVTSLIEREFDQVSLKPILNASIQQRNDFKMLLLNLLSSFEMKMKRLGESIKEKKDNLDPNIESLKNTILSKLNIIISNSVDQIANLNQPILRALSNYRQIALKTEDLKNEYIWKIKSTTLINEHIINAIHNSTSELIIIIPNLKDYLSNDLLEDLPKNLRIRIASSDPHVNSKVMKLKSIENLEFRNYENKNFIGLKSDEDLLFMGFIDQDPEDILDNFTGIGINNSKLVKLFQKALYNVWSAAEPDYGGVPKKPMRSSPTPAPTPTKTKQYTQSHTQQSRPNLRQTDLERSKKLETIETKPKGEEKLSEKIGNELKTSIEKNDREKMKKEKKPQVSGLGIAQDFKSKITPKPDDSVGMEINTAFNSLLKKLNELTGQTFAQSLEKIADLILEKRGFSVTLHDLRRTINDYKNARGVLSGGEKEQIFNKIEEWKNRLF